MLRWCAMTRAEEAAALYASGLTYRQVAERMGLPSKDAARVLAYRASSDYKTAQLAKSLERQERRKPKISAAEHQRAYRERQKAKATQSTDNRSPERLMSDAALEAAIMQRGRQLSAMMRTPFCMWPSDWCSDD